MYVCAYELFKLETGKLSTMIDANEYSSKRTTGDDQQQQDGRRNRAMGSGKTDFRFLIPSRDAGGLFDNIRN